MESGIKADGDTFLSVSNKTDQFPKMATFVAQIKGTYVVLGP